MEYCVILWLRRGNIVVGRGRECLHRRLAARLNPRLKMRKLGLRQPNAPFHSAIISNNANPQPTCFLLTIDFYKEQALCSNKTIGILTKRKSKKPPAPRRPPFLLRPPCTYTRSLLHPLQIMHDGVPPVRHILNHICHLLNKQEPVLRFWKPEASRLRMRLCPRPRELRLHPRREEDA